MTCDPEKVTGFVDSVLGDADLEALREHMRGCPACSDQAEAEHALRARLREVDELALPETTAARVRTSLRRRPRRLRYWLPLAAGLFVALWARGNPEVLAWELARDHDHCFAKDPVPAKIWSSDAQVVDAWFRERGTPLPHLPATAGELQLVGGRYCPLPGLTQAAHLYYASADHVLSVFVVPRAVRLDAAHEARARGRAVRLLRISDRIVGLVADRDEDLDALTRELLQLRVDAEPRANGVSG